MRPNRVHLNHASRLAGPAANLPIAKFCRPTGAAFIVIALLASGTGQAAGAPTALAAAPTGAAPAKPAVITPGSPPPTISAPTTAADIAPNVPTPAKPAPTTRRQAPPLTGTLAKIAARGIIAIGTRSNAIPFSFSLPNGQPTGFAVDLCKALVADIGDAIGGTPPEIAYTRVTAENRIEKVVSGTIDIECGATTRNDQRQQLVAFSPPFYIGTTRLMVPPHSPIRSYNDLTGRTVVVTGGTDSADAIRTLADRMLVRMKLITTTDRTRSLDLLHQGKADAFATDDIRRVGQADAGGYRLVGEPLSREPYSLIFRRDDPAFAKVIDDGFRRLASSGKLAVLYDKWLMEPLPDGRTVGMPPGRAITEEFHRLGQPN